MKKIILTVLVLGMFAWAVVDMTLSSKQDGNGTNSVKEEESLSGSVGIQKWEIAPNFELTTLDGETVSLHDYRGKKVFINFWATWCPPCRAEMPDMEKLYKSREDIEILAVNLTSSEQNEEVVGEFVEDFGLTFPILMDRNADVSTMFQVSAYPTSYMIDSEGRIQSVVIGAMNYDLMLQEIEKMN